MEPARKMRWLRKGGVRARALARDDLFIVEDVVRTKGYTTDESSEINGSQRTGSQITIGEELSCSSRHGRQTDKRMECSHLVYDAL